MNKEKLFELLFAHSIHGPGLIRFLEEAIQTNKQVALLTNDAYLDFDLMQGVLLLEALKSKPSIDNLLSN